VEQCVALADGPLVTEPLVAEALRARAAQALPTLAEARDDFERDYLIRALRMAGGQVPQAADLAGRNRTDFYRLLRKHSIEPDDFKGDRQDSGAAPLATD
jgi:two-component system, NtrC family, response regulator GlrR